MPIARAVFIGPASGFAVQIPFVWRAGAVSPSVSLPIVSAAMSIKPPLQAGRNSTYGFPGEMLWQHEILRTYGWTILTGGVVLVLTLLSKFAGFANGSGVPHKSGLPLVGSWSFFTRRHRFVDEGVRRLGNVFSFKILHARYSA